MISAYIDRIEEDKAVMLLGDENRKVNFPVEYLPDGIGEGDFIHIDIKRDTEKEDEAVDDLLDLWQSTKG